MRYIQALKENKYDFSSLPNDIQKATKLVLKSKNYNSKIESLDLITFNSIRNSQPVDERIEDLYKLSKNDNPIEENNGFNTPASIDEVEEEFASGGHIAEKTDDNKVRQTKVRFHLGKGENFMKWKVENPKTKDVEFFNPDDVQLEMYNCKLTNSPKTAMKIFTGEIDKSPIAWVVCEDVDISSVVEPVDPEERLSYNPRTAPNWLDSDGDIVDNYVFEKLVTFGRGVYYEAPDGKLFALGGLSDSDEYADGGGGDMSKHLAPNGKPSLLTHEQWHLVRTPAFKKWFGDWQNDPEDSSKVVDINKEPLVVFHGSHSKENFSVFEYRGDSYGFHFGTKQSAQDRLRDLSAEMFYGGNPRILEVFLNIKNPIKLKDYNKQEYEDAEELGKDGVIYENEVEDVGSISYAVFSSNQIKLADGTNTTFDSNNPDIRFETGGGVQSSQLKKIKDAYDFGSEYFDGEIYGQKYKIRMNKNHPRNSSRNDDQSIHNLSLVNSDYPSAKVLRESNNKLQWQLDKIYYWEDAEEQIIEFFYEIKDRQDEFATGGAVQKTSPDIYENNLLQIRVIGGDYAYYTKVNKEWKFLSESIVSKLKEGAKHELEHTGTIQAFKRKDIPNEIVATFIAYDHINEDSDYYKKLNNLIPEKMNNGGKIEDYLSSRSQMFDDSSKTLTKAEVEKFAKLSKDSPNKFWVKDVTTGYSYYIFKGWLRKNDSTEGIYKTSSLSFSDLKDTNAFKIEEKELFEWEKDLDPDKKRYGWDLISYKFGEIYYTNSDETDEELVGSEVKAEKRLWQFDRYSPYPIRLSWSEAEDMFKKSLTKDELNSIEISYTTDEYADIEEHDVEREYRNIIVKKKAIITNTTTPVKKYAFDLKSTDVILDPESNTKKTIERTDVFDKYINLWFTDSTMTRISNVGPHLSRFEIFSNPETDIKNTIKKPKEKKETLMENPKPIVSDTYSGSASNWNSVPVRWRNIKAVRPVTFSINPYDKGLLSIVDVFTGDDDLRPIMSAIHFEDKGLVCTDAHKLLHLHYDKSDFKGNYPSLDSVKAFGKETSKAEVEKNLKEGKFPNWEAVIPRDSEFTYEIDTMKLYQYCKVALNYSNKTTHQVSFKYEKSNQIGYNGQFLIESLEAMMKIQKCPKVYIHITSPSRASILSFTKSITPTSSTYCLLMPVMVNSSYSNDDKPKQIYGASDIDYNKSLSCYFDFTDSQIHNADGTIADYKESYGDSNEMPLELITLMDKFIKTAKTNLPILENVCVDGNGIRVDSIDSRIEIANDWKIPQGLYIIDNNALIRSDFNMDFEDYPNLTNRVSLKEPLFTMDSDVFKFYIDKAFINVGKDELRETLTGFGFEHSKGSNFSLISTDAHIVFHANLMKYAKNLKKENFKFIAGEVKQLINFSKNIDTKEISFYATDPNSDGKYRISAGRLHFEAKQIYGKFPNWEGIVPREISNQISFNIKDLFVCMNNEASKSFAKSEGLKPVDLGIYNQGDKIFLSNRPSDKRPEDLISKEICEMKIDKVTFPNPKSFNIYQNFVLLMPLSYTNGNYFNFGVEPINRVISTIGKEKVIAEYTELNRSYIFTSDNLDFNTSDVYKPEKEISKPIKIKIPSQQNTGKNPSEFNKGDIIIDNRGMTFEVKTPLTKDNFTQLIRINDTALKGHIDEIANTKYTKVFKLVEKNSIKTPPVKSVSGTNEDAELRDAIRGLEAFVKTSKLSAQNPAKLQVEQAIKGLKALLK